ncbi:MAG: thioredoxin [Candidatus Omnitrophica bacterium]|nr:thioredoxin [Candidatus Omnitrophota bacterium]
MEVNLTTQNFDQEVMQSDVPVLVDFWAPWCGPCQMVAPAVESIASSFEGKLKVGKLNVDEAPEIATQYTVMSIPTLLLFKDGKIMEKKIGATSKEDLEKFVAPHIS